MQPCFLLVRCSPCWVCLPKPKTINFFRTEKKKVFFKDCWLKPCAIPLAERKLEFDFHMQLHTCLNLASLLRTVHLFISAFWIALLCGSEFPKIYDFFFQFLRYLILIFSVLYCKINHDSFNFLFTWRMTKNVSINSPMLLLSTKLLCFSLFDGHCCSQSLNHHKFRVCQLFELWHLDLSFITKKNLRIRFKTRVHLFCCRSHCLCQRRLWLLIT